MHGWNEPVGFYKTPSSASLISMKSPEMYPRRLFLSIPTKIQGRNETTKEISSNSLFVRYDCDPPLRVPSALCPRHGGAHTCNVLLSILRLSIQQTYYIYLQLDNEWFQISRCAYCAGILQPHTLLWDLIESSYQYVYSFQKRLTQKRR